MKVMDAKVVHLTIDIDAPNTIEIVKKYKVNATPIILDSQGKILKQVVGKIEKKKKRNF